MIPTDGKLIITNVKIVVVSTEAQINRYLTAKGNLRLPRSTYQFYLTHCRFLQICEASRLSFFVDLRI